MAFRDVKDLAKRTAFLRDKAFDIAKNSKSDINFLIKSLEVVVLIMKLNKMCNWPKNYTSHLLKKNKKEEFTLHLKTIFGVLI